MRRCAGCLREIPDGETVCECGGRPGDPTAERVTTGARSAGDPQAVPMAAMPQHVPPGLSPRDWSLIALVAAAAGVLTLALLMSRAVVSPASAHVPAPSSSPAPDTDVSGSAGAKWSSENRARWVGNDRKATAFELPGRNRVAIWTRQVRPMLVVRCVRGEIDAFVFTETAAQIEPQTEDHTVRFAFDDEPETAERWADSVDHDGLFAPDGGLFARRLMLARTLRFGFTPHNMSPVVVHFDVAGLRELVEPAAKECGGKK